jgi:hypothetical protein
MLSGTKEKTLGVGLTKRNHKGAIVRDTISDKAGVPIPKFASIRSGL